MFESQLDLKFFLILPCRYIASGPVLGGLIAPADLFRLCLGWYVDCIRLYMYSLLVMQLHHAGHAITCIVGLEI